MFYTIGKNIRKNQSLKYSALKSNLFYKCKILIYWVLHVIFHISRCTKKQQLLYFKSLCETS